VLHRADGRGDFFGYVERLKETIRVRMESDDHFLSLAQRALAGDVLAIATSSKEIEKHIRQTPYTGRIPESYSGFSLTEAIYQEWLGFSVVAPWFLNRSYANSGKMQIIGTSVAVATDGEYQPYPYAFHSVERVSQLMRTLARQDERVRIDPNSPSAEFKLDDPLWPGRFVRVAMWIPPRTWHGYPVITFRRKVVEQMSLDDQAGSGLIAPETASVFSSLSQLYPNLIISGPVDSGKTTFADTLVAEQLKHAGIALGVILIENHPESTLPLAKVARSHRVTPLIANPDELMEVGIESLRHDPDVIYMSEMRWGEWLFYNFAGEKGYRGLIGTYHTTDAEDIPYQGANAAYATGGGSLRGHLLGVLKSVEIVAVLMPLANGKKKLVRLSEIRYDPGAVPQVYANDWIRFDFDNQCWTYNADISPVLWERMTRVNRALAERFRAALAGLAAAHPMASPIVPSRKCQAVLGVQS